MPPGPRPADGTLPDPWGQRGCWESLAGATHSTLTLTHRFCHPPPPRGHRSQGRAGGRPASSVPRGPI